jgi:hypothetical protein
MSQRSWTKLFFGFAALAIITAIIYVWTDQKETSPKQDTQNLLDFENDLKGSIEVAHWIYENHGCNSCHTLSKGGYLGLTAQGKKVGSDFQGCPGMLQTVSETVQTPESQWSDHQRKIRQDFTRFGCATCHHVGEKQITLTAIGSKAAVLHMSCSGVMNTLSRKSN